MQKKEMVSAHVTSVCDSKGIEVALVDDPALGLEFGGLIVSVDPRAGCHVHRQGKKPALKKRRLRGNNSGRIRRPKLGNELKLEVLIDTATHELLGWRYWCYAGEYATVQRRSTETKPRVRTTKFVKSPIKVRPGLRTRRQLAIMR